MASEISINAIDSYFSIPKKYGFSIPKLRGYYLISVIFQICLLQNVNGFTRNSIDFYTQTDNTIRLEYSTDRVEQKYYENLVRKEVLGLLGLHEAPKPLPNARRLAAPQFMLELYKHIEDNDVDDVTMGYSTARHDDITKFNITSQWLGKEASSSDIIVSFLNHAAQDSSNDAEMVFTFANREVPAMERVTLAELRVYKSLVQTDMDSYTLHLERVADSASNGYQVTEKVSTTIVTSQMEGWLEINVTMVAEEWLTMSLDNLTLSLTATDTNGKTVSLREVGLNPEQNQEDTQSFMVAFFSARPIKLQQRQRRDAPSKERRKSAQRANRRKNNKRGDLPFNFSKKRRARSCHREAFFVRFSDLNWQDWVIAPDGYAAYLCKGKCTFPLNAHMNATYHAMMQTLVSLMQGPRIVPLPCCAPTKLRHISVLFLDETSNVLIWKFENMVVTACGCQ